MCTCFPDAKAGLAIIVSLGDVVMLSWILPDPDDTSLPYQQTTTRDKWMEAAPINQSAIELLVEQG